MAIKKDLIIRIGSNVDDLEKGLRKAEMRVKAFQVGFAAAGTAAAVSFNNFKNFQSDFSDVVTLLDDTSFKTKSLTGGINDLKSGVLSLGSQTGESFENLNKGLFDLVSAGVAAEDAIDSLRVSTNLAIAGATDTSIAVDGITSALNAYGENAGTAQDVAEKFFTAQKGGKTTIEELSSGFGLAGASANAFGVSLDELLAGVAAVTTGGIQTNAAYTGLNAVLSNVAKPTKDAADEAKRLGIEFNSTALRSKGLKGFLDEITSSSKFSDTSLEKLFGSVEALKVAQSLTGAQSEKFSEILGQLGDKSLTTTNFQNALNEKMNDGARQIEIMKQSVASASIALGEFISPFVISQARYLTSVVEDAKVGFHSLAVIVKSLGKIFVEVFNFTASKFDEFIASILKGLSAALENFQKFADKLPFVESSFSETIDKINTKAQEYEQASEERAKRANEFFRSSEEAKTEALAEGLEQRNQKQFENDALMDEYDAERRENQLELDAERREEDLENEDARHEEDLERLSQKINDKALIEEKGRKDSFTKTKKLSKDAIKVDKEEVDAKKKNSAEELANEVSFLKGMVSENTFAAKAINAIEKARAVAGAIMNAHEGASRALRDHPAPQSYAIAAVSLAKGLVEVGSIRSTAFAAKTGGVVPGTGSGDRPFGFLEPGEIIVPKPLAETFEQRFGNFPKEGGGSGDVNVVIGLSDEASQVFSVQLYEDQRIGVSR